MTVNLEQKGLGSIVNEFDLFFIDIWGVVHNGIRLNPDAIEVLEKLNNHNKDYILLTNAPRPNSTVINFLNKMGLASIHCKKVYTSGEAALSFLSKKSKKLKFFHIGPPRDFDLFFSFKDNRVKNIDNCQFLLCTGLFDEYFDDLNYYRDLLKNKKKLKMICTNPDLIVNRGDKQEYCAGSIAKIFEEEGGEVEYFGKPYPLVYKLSADLKNKKILCIGDNLNTDIKGANLQKFSSLFISSGIHKNESNLNLVFKNHNVRVDYLQSFLKW
tara:strand:- start:80 stop:889 length:810 start_codon:yes stop_codon:yes gene_type:complete